MQGKSLRWAVQTVVLLLAASLCSSAQGPRQAHFRGLLSDYTSLNKGGPWDVRGPWNLKVDFDSGQAEFSAALAMVHSDMGVTLSANPNLNDPAARNAHTHHISMVEGKVTVAPDGKSFTVTGPAIITGNGKFPAPFGASSTLQIVVSGDNAVPYSNIQVTFQGDAASHFGTLPVNGVVTHSPDRDGDEDK